MILPKFNLDKIEITFPWNLLKISFEPNKETHNDESEPVSIPNE